MVKRVGESRYPCQTPTVVFEPACYAAIEEDCTGCLVIKLFGDSDKVGTDVVLLHGCPQSCVPNPVEGLLESMKT